MRTLLFALLTLAPAAAAEAGVDFKCDSVRYQDQVGGWLRFSSNGREGSVNMEYWNGYPPITLVDAPFATPTTLASGAVQFVSSPDRYAHDTVATLELPSGFVTLDSFAAKIDMRYQSPENGRLRVMKYDLKCTRH